MRRGLLDPFTHCLLPAQGKAPPGTDGAGMCAAGGVAFCGEYAAAVPRRPFAVFPAPQIVQHRRRLMPQDDEAACSSSAATTGNYVALNRIQPVGDKNTHLTDQPKQTRRNVRRAKKGNPATDPPGIRVGRLNRRKWQGFTSEGLQRLRDAALRHRPWEHSTGPRTAEGKRRSSQNGRYRQTNALSRREIQREREDVDKCLTELFELRKLIV